MARIIGGSKISPMEQYDIYLTQQLRKDTPAVGSHVQISILSVLIPYLAQSASALYTISVFSRASAAPCRGAQLRCHNYPDLQCCAAPPHRESFVEAGVTSSGRPGVVLFHDTDITGHCLGCTGGGSINRCIENQPFEPISVVDPQGILEKTLEIAGSAIRGAHCITLGSHYPSFFDPPKSKSEIWIIRTPRVVRKSMKMNLDQWTRARISS